jgi:hypothetical protein
MNVTIASGLSLSEISWAAVLTQFLQVFFAFSKLDCAKEEDRLAVTRNNNYQKISYVHHGMIIKISKEHLGYFLIIVFQK